MVGNVDGFGRCQLAHLGWGPRVDFGGRMGNSASWDTAWQRLWAGRIVVVDVETTGFNAEGDDRIVQVGMILLDDGAESWRWSTLVNPDRDTGPVHVHGISNEAAASAPRFAEVRGTMSQALLGARAIVAHNASFDLRFLRAEFTRCNAVFPNLPILDTRLLARILGLELESERLPDVAAAYGLAHDRHHDALADADVTASILIRELSDGFAQQGWRDIQQIARLEPPEQYAGVRRSRSGGGGGLSLTIDVTDTDWARYRREADAEDAARRARSSPAQLATWEEFTSSQYSDGGLSIELVDRARSLWPAGDADLLVILEGWRSHVRGRFQQARSKKGKAEWAPTLLTAHELVWEQLLIGPACVREAATGSYDWADALIVLPTDQAIEVYSQTMPRLLQWPACGQCMYCQEFPTHEVWSTTNIADAVLPYTSVDAKSDSLKEKRDTAANQWVAAFTEVGDHRCLAALTRRRIAMLESLEEYQRAVDAGWQALDAGVTIDLNIPNRMGLIYERKLADLAQALRVSDMALSWPSPEYGGKTALEAIVKRAQRIRKKM